MNREMGGEGEDWPIRGSFWIWRPLIWTRERRSRRRGGDWERKQEAGRQLREVEGQKKSLGLGGVFAVPLSQMDRLKQTESQGQVAF